MTQKSVTPLTKSELEALPTERLLAYLRRLQECEESVELSDSQESEIESGSAIVFKSSEAWKAQYRLVKAVLSRRPNID